jgi:hypothetical protein
MPTLERAPAEELKPGVQPDDVLWRWTLAHVNWTEIEYRLAEEFSKHSHRRENRALELASGMALEKVEYCLAGFKGSFEEKIAYLANTVPKLALAMADDQEALQKL